MGWWYVSSERPSHNKRASGCGRLGGLRPNRPEWRDESGSDREVSKRAGPGSRVIRAGSEALNVM